MHPNSDGHHSAILLLISAGHFGIFVSRCSPAGVQRSERVHLVRQLDDDFVHDDIDPRRQRSAPTKHIH